MAPHRLFILSFPHPHPVVCAAKAMLSIIIIGKQAWYVRAAPDDAHLAVIQLTDVPANYTVALCLVLPDSTDTSSTSSACSCPGSCTTRHLLFAGRVLEVTQPAAWSILNTIWSGPVLRPVPAGPSATHMAQSPWHRSAQLGAFRLPKHFTICPLRSGAGKWTHICCALQNGLHIKE